MRRLVSALAATLLLAAAAASLPVPVAAQSLAERIRGAPAHALLGFHFPARSDVCGYQDAIIRFRPHSTRGYDVMLHDGARSEVAQLDSAELRSRCDFGPVRVQLARTAGEITDLQVRVGGAAEPGAHPLGEVNAAAGVAYPLGGVSAAAGVAYPLGGVSAAAGVAYLVELGRTAPPRTANLALATVLLAEGEHWQPLLALGRDRAAPESARTSAVFWLGQAAGDRATAGLRGLLEDESEELQLRTHALFALSQQESRAAEDALIDVAQSSPEPAMRRHALFWLGQRGDNPRVLALFEKILLEKE